MQSNDFLDILNKIREYNELMSSAIEGPSCIDPNVCHGDCCHIQIDIPKILAEFYIKNGWATKNHFERGNVFSFMIAVRERDSKCVFFDDKLNGCSLHATKMKPPQCWIYPTGFDIDIESKNKNDDNIRYSFNNFEYNNESVTKTNYFKCKRAEGWKIIDQNKTQRAKQILKEYINFSLAEFVEEHSEQNLRARIEHLRETLSNEKPSSIAGIKDSWDGFIPLYAEGKTLALKKICERFCEKTSNKKKNIKKNINNFRTIQISNFMETYMNCTRICNRVVNYIVEHCQKKIISNINKANAMDPVKNGTYKYFTEILFKDIFED
ncbi:MAG: hypothetical protein ACTSRZ_15605 [Promethearchaeota archaeon]